MGKAIYYIANYMNISFYRIHGQMHYTRVDIRSCKRRACVILKTSLYFVFVCFGASRRCKLLEQSNCKKEKKKDTIKVTQKVLGEYSVYLQKKEKKKRKKSQYLHIDVKSIHVQCGQVPTASLVATFTNGTNLVRMLTTF